MTRVVSVTERMQTNRQRDALLELIREWLLVEEDIGIAEALVKAILHLFNAPCCAIDVAIARKHDDRCICSTIRYK